VIARLRLVESLNSSLRDERLSEHVFMSDHRSLRDHYNQGRPDSGLGALRPSEFAQLTTEKLNNALCT
jgi:hypothetical protein